MSFNVTKLSLFRTIDGRHTLSVWASRVFERSGISRLFGLNLVAAVLVTGVVSPESDNFFHQLAIESRFKDTPIIAETTTETTFETPLADFKLSQNFSFWHPGVDLTDPEGTPVYAIDAGIVDYAGYSLLGYGKHVVISHEHGFSSLYGHLSEIKTVVGRRVTRGELIGKVGSTGWSTGNHLHLEIHQNGVPLNPLELLPLNPKEIKYDGAFGQTASPSALPKLSPLLSANN